MRRVALEQKNAYVDRMMTNEADRCFRGTLHVKRTRHTLLFEKEKTAALVIHAKELRVMH